MTDRLSS